MLVETSSCNRCVFEMTAVWAASSLYQHVSIDGRDSSFAFPVGRETATISAKQRLTVHRYHQQPTVTLPTVNQYTSDCWLQHVSWGVGRVSTDILTDSVDRRSIDLNNMSTDTLLTLGRHIDRISVDMSTDCRSTYRTIVWADTIDQYSYTWSENSCLRSQS